MPDSKDQIPVNQGGINAKILQLIKLDRAESAKKEELDESKWDGLCFGYAVVHSYMASIGKTRWWQGALEHVSQWDGSIETLSQPVVLPQSETPNETLGSLVRKVADFLVFNNASRPMLVFEGIRQMDFLLSNSLFGCEKGHFTTHCSLIGEFNEDILGQLLKEEYFSQESIYLISSRDHACSIRYSHPNWYFYNPNSKGGEQCFPRDKKNLLIQEIYEELGYLLQINLASWNNSTKKVMAALMEDYKKICIENPGVVTCEAIDFMRLWDAENFDSLSCEDKQRYKDYLDSSKKLSEKTGMSLLDSKLAISGLTTEQQLVVVEHYQIGFRKEFFSNKEHVSNEFIELLHLVQSCRIKNIPMSEINRLSEETINEVVDDLRSFPQKKESLIVNIIRKAYANKAIFSQLDRDQLLLFINSNELSDVKKIVDASILARMFGWYYEREEFIDQIKSEEIKSFIMKSFYDEVQIDFVHYSFGIRFLQYASDAIQIKLCREDPKKFLQYASKEVQLSLCQEDPEKFLQYSPRVIQLSLCQEDPGQFLQHACESIQRDLCQKNAGCFFKHASITIQQSLDLLVIQLARIVNESEFQWDIQKIGIFCAQTTPRGVVDAREILDDQDTGAAQKLHDLHALMQKKVDHAPHAMRSRKIIQLYNLLNSLSASDVDKTTEQLISIAGTITPNSFLDEVKFSGLLEMLDSRGVNKCLKVN